MRRPTRPDEERLWMNWAMHWGQGVLLGGLRGLMARRGLRGPVGSFLFMNLRLINDQTLENATGVGAPPWTWPIDEQVIDLFQKAVYAFVTGTSPTGSSRARPLSRHDARTGGNRRGRVRYRGKLM